MKKLLFCLTGLLLVISFPASAQTGFVIEDIRVVGLQRVTAGAVYVALPVRVGDRMNDQTSAAAIQDLYATGLFDDVQLSRDGGILVITVIERPTIASIEVNGNKKIKDEAIENALAAGDMKSGDIYNPEVVESFISELKEAYVEVGHFSVDVSVSVTPLERNRVDLVFTVYEGKVALIREIQLVGNDKIPDEDILDLMQLTTKKTFGLLNRNNRYSREKLRADLEAIVNHYHDLGYINFSINSSRVFITDDRKGILIVVTLSEGPQFRFGTTRVSSSKDVISQEQLDSLIEIRTGALYSFQQVSNTRTRISDEFANEGYARAEVDPLPTINDEAQTIDLNYVVDPGKLTYIRRITINGNITTDDEVIRREMRIYEGGQYSAEQIQNSRSRLGRLGIFTRVDIQIVDVPEVEDQVDVIVEVDESLTGSLLFGVGYSDSDKTTFNFSVAQKNLYGTGKELSLSTEFSASDQAFLVDYTNPYYTLDGVSRGFTLEYGQSDTAETDSTSIYDIGRAAVGMNYGFPLSEVSTLGIDFRGFNYKLDSNENVNRNATTTSDYHIHDYRITDSSGNSGVVTMRYRRDTRNRAVFASEGSDLDLSLEMSGGKLQYYLLRAGYTYYVPIADEYTLRLSGRVDYGQDTMPFFENFYMTGSSTIRGFDSDSLGPHEVCRTNSSGTITYAPCEDARSIGGNVRLITRAELYLPFFGTQDSADKRFSLFLDSGNTFLHSDRNYKAAYDSRISEGGRQYFGHEKFRFSNIRSSMGVGFEWLSPIGPFGISYAVPVREKPGDVKDRFQITLGYLQN